MNKLYYTHQDAHLNMQKQDIVTCTIRYDMNTTYFDMDKTKHYEKFIRLKSLI